MNILRNKLFIAILFIYGCTSSQTTHETTIDNNQLDNKILAEESEKLDGEWYGEKYLNDIEKTKSIFANKDYKTEIFGFVLDKKNLMGETPILNGFHVHEGGYGANLKFDQQKKIFINDLSKNSEFDAFPKPFELKLVKNDNLEMYFPENKKVDIYKKIIPDLQTELRKILFAGNYINLNDNSEIKFTKDGKISNWGEYIYYEFAYDFGEGIEYDAVAFFKTMKGSNWTTGKIFKFEIESDTLKLQLIKPDWDGFEHEITNEIYVLKKE